MVDEFPETRSRILDYAQPRTERDPIFTARRMLLAIGSVFFAIIFLGRTLEDNGIGALSILLGGVLYILVRSAQEKRVAVFWRILTALAGIFYLCAASVSWIDFWREPWPSHQNWGWYWQDENFRNGVWILLGAISTCAIVRSIAFFARGTSAE